MSGTPATDQRVRKRVSVLIGNGKTAIGKTSLSNVDITYCNRHYITIFTTGVVSAGTVSVRGEPMYGTKLNSFVPIGIEAVNLATATNFTFAVAGFFDAFQIDITATVTGGGSIGVVVNSTIEN